MYALFFNAIKRKYIFILIVFVIDTNSKSDLIRQIRSCAGP